MSADFEKAIAFGATHVRVGSQIFGDARQPRASLAADSTHRLFPKPPGAGPVALRMRQC